MLYAKQKPRIIKYRDYKNFNSITFRMDPLKELSLSKLQKGGFDKFKFIANNLLESHAPMKEKYIRRNEAPFMNKSVRKAVMVRTQLLNKFRKENPFINELAYNKERNFCTKLIKRTKRNFYKTQCTGTDDLFFKVQTKKIIIRRIYYSPILLCTSYLDVLF